MLPNLTAVYHASSRCTRQLSMLRDGGGEGGAVYAEPDGFRKEMLTARLEALVGILAVQIIAFAIMDNHVHTLLRVDHELAAGWSDEEVLRRWWALHPLRDGYNRPRDAEDQERAEALADSEFLASCRWKLVSLSHFMKCFKQHAAEQINKLEETSGPVWAGRFHSVLVKDQEQLLATMIYVDLNPFAAGECVVPEDGRYTSLAGRLERDVPAASAEVEAPGDADPADLKLETLSTPDGPRMPHRRACGAWLRPLDESLERQRTRGQRPLRDRPASAGTVAAGLSLRVYLRLLDAVARRFREGKHRLGTGTRRIFERLGLDAEAVTGRVLAMVEKQHRGLAR